MSYSFEGSKGEADVCSHHSEVLLLAAKPCMLSVESCESNHRSLQSYIVLTASATSFDSFGPRPLPAQMPREVFFSNVPYSSLGPRVGLRLQGLRGVRGLLARCVVGCKSTSCLSVCGSGCTWACLPSSSTFISESGLPGTSFSIYPHLRMRRVPAASCRAFSSGRATAVVFCSAW